MQTKPPYTFFPLGDNGILIDFGNELDEVINKEVLRIFRKIKEKNLPFVLDVIPAYSSLAIHYDVMKIVEKAAGKTVFDIITDQLKKIAGEGNEIYFEENRKINIPVCYDEEFGPDLTFLANEKELSIQDVIHLHSIKTYRVYMIGFLPGFAYMGRVDPRIQMPRKENPRTNLEAGSVGIAGAQTGIYPMPSPGGWQIIGRTPVAIFDKLKAEPVLLKPGDQVRFFQSAGMSLEITRTGILDTIQDNGRYGLQHLGINPCGSMDGFSAQLSNALIGKDLNDPVFELHFPASRFLFKRSTIICLAGADFSAFVNEIPVPIHQPVYIKEGSWLGFKDCKWGVRCYLSILHKMQVNKWLESYSTHLKAEAGGWQGGKLKAGDRIGLMPEDLMNFKNIHNQLLPWKAEGIKKNYTTRLQVMIGNEWNWLTKASQLFFQENDYQVSIQTDRMGYRLAGKNLKIKEEISLLSSPVNFGTIQLLPGGQLIILMADHQTTGGYPRVAHVISADLPLLAQAGPNDLVSFHLTDLDSAQEKLIQQQKYLQQIREMCKLKVEKYLFP